MEIVLNRESKRKTFSAIAVHEGQRLFGEDAALLATKFPQKTYQQLIKLVGRKYDDEVASKYRSNWPVKMIKNETRETISFQVSEDLSYTVEVVPLSFLFFFFFYFYFHPFLKIISLGIAGHDFA